MQVLETNYLRDFYCLRLARSAFFQSFGGLTVSTPRKAASGLNLNFSGSFAHAGRLGLVMAFDFLLFMYASQIILVVH